MASEQLQIDIPGLDKSLVTPDDANFAVSIIYPGENEVRGAHWCGMRALDRAGIPVEDLTDYDEVNLMNMTDEQEAAGVTYYGAVDLVPESADYLQYQLLSRVAGLLKLEARLKIGQELSEALNG